MSWSPRQRRKNDLLFAAARIAIRLGLALPRAWLPRVGTHLGSLAYALLAGPRRATIANLALVHPDLEPAAQRRLARAVFRSLGASLTDTLALLDSEEDPARTLTMTASSERVLADALALGRGVIYATCHLGPWERMAALLAQRGFPITTIARESYDPRFHELVFDKLRARRGVQVIYRGNAAAPLAIVRALRKGRVLGLLLDMPGRIATEEITWLGLPSRMPAGAARLALRLGTPVVVGTPAPHSTGLTIRITRLMTDDLAHDAHGEAVLNQRIADALSERIRGLPTHWPWMHPTFGAPRRLRGARPFAALGTIAPSDRCEEARWPRVGV